MQQYRAQTLQQPSNLRAALKHAYETNSCLVGTCLSIPSTDVAKILAVTGADWAWIDAEHTPFSPPLLKEIVQTISFYSEGKMVPVVRVPTHGHEWMAWALDAGAGAILVPHTETPEQARHIVNSCCYPPLGHRSMPPFALIPGLTDMPGRPLETANEHVAVIPQIESKLGIENLEAIMQVPGVTAIMIGMGDLALDMGLKLDISSASNPEFIGYMLHVKALAEKYRLPLVGYTPSEPEAFFISRLDLGYLMVCGSADQDALVQGLVKDIKKQREMAEEWKAKQEAAKESQVKTNGNA